MAVLPIVKLGHPALRRKARPVTEFDQRLTELARHLIDTMRVNDGIGLAANQINVLQRIFAIDFKLLDETQEARVFVNPQIVRREGIVKMEEGCLSIPGVRADVIRPETIEVEYQDLEGKMHREVLTELPARVFQHELDHLEGVLFIDYLSPFQKKLLEPQLKAIQEANLPL